MIIGHPQNADGSSAKQGLIIGLTHEELRTLLANDVLQQVMPPGSPVENVFILGGASHAELMRILRQGSLDAGKTVDTVAVDTRGTVMARDITEADLRSDR